MIRLRLCTLQLCTALYGTPVIIQNVLQPIKRLLSQKSVLVMTYKCVSCKDRRNFVQVGMQKRKKAREYALTGIQKTACLT